MQGRQAVDTKRGTSFLVLLRAVTIFTQGESVESDLGGRALGSKEGELRR